MADSGKASQLPTSNIPNVSSTYREQYSSNRTSGSNRNSVDMSKASRPVNLADSRPKSMNMSERQRVMTEQDDPLKADVSLTAPKPSKKASLSIKLEDEVRIVKALHDAAKKKTSGRIFSVIVDLSQYPHNLSIGVKDLTDQILCVSLLKRSDDMPGAGEQAGIRLGDVVFGINFMPVRDGSRTLLTQLKAEIELKKSRYVHIQAWRCAQLCSDAVPGYTFPQADELFVRGYDMQKNRVFSVWEMWNFMEILLSHMAEDLRGRTLNPALIEPLSPVSQKRASARGIKNSVWDLERTILQAKGLRTLLDVRILHSVTKQDTTQYVMRVEDVESGLQWTLRRRYNNFLSICEEIADISPLIKDIPFPRRKLSFGPLFRASQVDRKLVEERVVQLEAWLRRCIASLSLFATSDVTASEALRIVQTFLQVDCFLSPLYPPPLDDQRGVESVLYAHLCSPPLSSPPSPCSLQCSRFVASIDLESCAAGTSESTPAHGLLTFMRDALAEVESFVTSTMSPALSLILEGRGSTLTEDQRAVLIGKCVRRQVENALYLPLRRQLMRLLSSLLAREVRQMQLSLQLLQQAKPSLLGVRFPDVQMTKAWGRCVKLMRRALLAYLPSDQGVLLLSACNAITHLHQECCERQARAEKGVETDGPSSPLLPRQPSAIASSPSSLTTLARSFSTFLSPPSPAPSPPSSILPGQSPVLPSMSLPVGAEADTEGSVVGGDGGLDDEEGDRVSFAVSPSTPHLLPLHASSNEDTYSSGPLRSLPSLASTGSGGGIASLNTTHDPPSLLISQAMARLNLLDKLDSTAHRKRTGRSTGSSSSPLSLSRTPSQIPSAAGEHQATPVVVRPSHLVLSEGPDDDAGEEQRGVDEFDIERRSDRPEVPPDLFREVFDRLDKQQAQPPRSMDEEPLPPQALSADDFFPLFTYVLIMAGEGLGGQVGLCKEVMLHLIRSEEAFGELGYYLATLEAAVQHIMDLAAPYIAKSMDEEPGDKRGSRRRVSAGEEENVFGDFEQAGIDGNA